MFMLLANADVVEPGFFPPHFIGSLVVSLIFAAVAIAFIVAFFPVAWKLMDKWTPGNLNEQLIGDRVTGRQPNMALAIVIGSVLASIILGVCVILAAAIH